MHEISKTPFFNMLVDEFFIFPESTSNANFGGVSKSMLTLNEAIIDVKEG